MVQPRLCGYYRAGSAGAKQMVCTNEIAMRHMVTCHVATHQFVICNIASC